jgi:ferredoxin-nitrite reductase
MGSGGFTTASHLNVFVEVYQAAAVVVELVKIFRDHGSREARSKCRFAFLVEKWGMPKLRAELTSRIGYELALRGRDMRSTRHADHLGSTPQKHAGLMCAGLCVPTGRVNPQQLEELARLADVYGTGEVRFTTGQNAVIPNVEAHRASALFREPLLREFSPRPHAFVRGLIACVGTDFCNLALIETKGRAMELSNALHQRLGSSSNPLRIHWSGCPAGCGNHEAADLGFRGLKTKINGKLVDAVAVYMGGRTGAFASAGKEILATVPCDESFPDVVANLIQSSQTGEKYESAMVSDPFFTAAATAGLASWRLARPSEGAVGAA